MDQEVIVNFQEGRRNGEIIKLPCSNCRSKNKHTIIASSNELAEIDGMWFGTDYLIVRCNGCDQQGFASIETSSENIGSDSEQEEYLIETINEYPPINVDFEKPKLYFSAPSELRDMHHETYKSLYTGSKKLASIGMRTIVEVICALHGINDAVAQTLPKKIDALFEQRVISPNMKGVLLRVKEFGDRGAHTLRTPQRAELIIAWESINILISSIYGTQDAHDNSEYHKGFQKRTKGKTTTS